MDDSGKRNLLLIGLLALALVVPMLLSPAKHAAPKGTGGKAQPAAAREKSAPDAGPSSAATSAARKALQKLGRIRTPEFSALVSSLNGGLTRFELETARYHSRGKPVDIVTTNREPYLPLAVDIDGLPVDARSTWDLQQLSPSAVLLSREAAGLRVSRKLEAGRSPYQLWLTTHIENRSDSTRTVQLHISTYHYVTREAEGGHVPLLPVRSAAISHALCRHDGDLERKDRKALSSSQSYHGPIVFDGIENVYFLSAVAPDSDDTLDCRLDAAARGGTEENPTGTLFSARLSYREVELAPHGSKTYRTLAYLGPKSPGELAAAGHSLKGAIQSGWFTSLAEGLTWLLRKIHEGVGNWGVAIILLTFLVKATLFPLTAKQMQSMARMKELKPELDRINELYGDDREKKGAAIMELYRKRGVNPMAGCFPVLLQLPIWFSLYASLSSNVELFRAPFALWWTDLSSPDPLFVLPLALGVLMFVQQKISPATGVDPLQQKLMLYMMPAMITSFMLFLPAGLCLYMFTNSALSIGQQRLIEVRLKTASKAPTEPESKDQDAPSPRSEKPSANEQPKGAVPSKAERRWRRGKR